MLSIFRYPGGKAKVRQKILDLAPEGYAEYREPFVGGGGVFFGTPPVSHWINDMHSGVVAVYTALRDRPDEFIAACRHIPTAEKCLLGTGKGRNKSYRAIDLERIFQQFVFDDCGDEALRYFVLQRCSFMGRVVYGDPQMTWYSAPEGWNVTKGDRLERAAEALQDVKITQGDFEPVLSNNGEDVWIFADPPYICDTEARQKGKLYQHSFSEQDHERLADVVRRCPHKVLMTYDDDPRGTVRSLYKGFDIVSESRFYGGVTCTKRKMSRELFIANYDLRADAILARVEKTDPQVAA